jgi:hypothetical protein
MLEAVIHDEVTVCCWLEHPVSKHSSAYTAAARPFPPPPSPHQPVMVLGSGASTATLLWFGLSGGFPAAAAARVVAGLLNGIIVSWKCSIGESCEPLEQGRVRLCCVLVCGGHGCVGGRPFLWAAVPFL